MLISASIHKGVGFKSRPGKVDGNLKEAAFEVTKSNSAHGDLTGI